MRTQPLTRDDLEGARAEVFHMIIFAMAWVMIGEYSLHFRDYVAAAAIVLAAAVTLGMQSGKLYEFEDSLPDPGREAAPETRKRRKRSQLYVSIFLFEGAAIMATWMILLHLGHQDWLVPGFALIAGLHFFPLARVVRLNSYYLLGIWICAVAVFGYLLLTWGKLSDTGSNVVIAYGCAAGAIADGASIIAMTKRTIGR